MSNLEVKIPDQMITDAVRAAMVEQLCKGNPEKFVEAIVKGAMEATDSRSYGRETLFQKEAGDMIRQQAIEVFREWLVENTDLLREKLLAHLNARKQAHLKVMVEGLCSDIGKWGSVRASFNFSPPED